MTVKLEETKTIVFPTKGSTGALADADALPTGVLYKDGVDSGATVTVTNITTGIYKAVFTVGSTDGFAVDDSASLVIFATIGTIDTAETHWEGVVKVADIDDAVAGLSDIANVGAATNTSATDDSTVTTGTVVSGTVASTEALDGTYWRIQDDGGEIDMYFEFSVGNAGVPASVKFTGRINGSNDSLNVYGYDWALTSWKQVGTLTGLNQADDSVHIYDLLNAMVGTGADAGKVRVRFQNTGLTAANFYIDQIFCSFSTIYS